MRSQSCDKKLKTYTHLFLRNNGNNELKAIFISLSSITTESSILSNLVIITVIADEFASVIQKGKGWIS